MIKEGTKVKVKAPVGHDSSISYAFLKHLEGVEGKVIGPANFDGFDVKVQFTEDVSTSFGFEERGLDWFGFKEEELEVLE